MSIVQVQLASDEEATVLTRKKRAYMGPPFWMGGKSGTTKKNIEGFPFMNILKDLTQSAHWLYWTLAEKRDPKTNIAYLAAASLNSTEKAKVTRGFKELHNKELIKRIKKEHYLINPRTTLPDPINEYADIQEKWDKLP